MRGLMLVAALAGLVALGGFVVPEKAARAQGCGGLAQSCSGAAVASCSGARLFSRQPVRRVLSIPGRLVGRLAARASCGG